MKVVNSILGTSRGVHVRHGSAGLVLQHLNLRSEERRNGGGGGEGEVNAPGRTQPSLGQTRHHTAHPVGPNSTHASIALQTMLPLSIAVDIIQV